MQGAVVFCFLIFCVSFTISQGVGSGTNGNLRLCIVEGRGSYKRGRENCPMLEEENSGVECVLGTDRLDCLRRISKGTVDFGVFSPEDLVAARWANVDVLVTNEVKDRARPFSRSIVAVVNKRLLTPAPAPIPPAALLRNSSLCHPLIDADDLRPLSDTFSHYLDTLLLAKSCDPELSLVENDIKDLAGFFAAACRAGAWLPDHARDEELKSMYPSLCAACPTRTCSKKDPYWGVSGALDCLITGAGDVTWGDLDDVTQYFQMYPSNSQKFAYLCRDGTHQNLTTPAPCVWLQKPWNIIVSKRKAAEAVSTLTSSMTNSSVTVDRHWHGALARLLEAHQELPPPLQPALTPTDYLARAEGFSEAYNQHECNPPRHITLCTTSVLENNKCNWLSEAGAVHGVAPALQCAWRTTREGCLQAVREGSADVTVDNTDWMPMALRNYSLTPILHEATPIILKSHTVFAYVKPDANLHKMADLRGKRAAFPRFDGVAWHSVLRYLANTTKSTCGNIVGSYFSDICAPGVERYNLSASTEAKLTKNCYKEGGMSLEGEVQALRSLVEGKSDVAFLSMNTYNLYSRKTILEPWAQNPINLSSICPEDNPKFCFVSWANVGQIYAMNNLTSMRRHEIVNLFTKLDQLFGKNHVNSMMFSMYGLFNHEADVIFHNQTKSLVTDDMFGTRPYSEIPFNFERNFNLTESCQLSDANFGAKASPAILLMLSLVVGVFLVK